MNTLLQILCCLLLLLFAKPVFCQIEISGQYPQYWQYNKENRLLLGGSDHDNLFQMPGVKAQLDLLQSVGGNYVRCTMASRNEGNVWAFYFDSEKQLYDLDSWNPEYWQRLENFLQWCQERGIIIQMEVWATFDYYRDIWDRNPFNPKNNSNYSTERTKIPEVITTHPVWCDNPFFWSIPSQHNNIPILWYQQKFMDKILSYTLQYDQVLYCIDNETSVSSEWGKFWANYIHTRAEEAGKTVNVTEMWDPHDLDHITHRETFDHPEIYDFVEISQNNHQKGEAHWNNGLAQIDRLRKSGNLRPVNNIKTYGATGGRHGHGQQNGIESFVRSIFFGSAAVRFHRPDSGIGLSDTAQAVIQGVRQLTDKMDQFFQAVPANQLLSERNENEAYCRAVIGKEYAVYSCQPGLVKLDLSAIEGQSISLESLDILKQKWSQIKIIKAPGKLTLSSPNKQHFFLIKIIPGN